MDIGSADVALELKSSAEGANALVHSRQSSAEYAVRRWTDAIVGNFDRQLAVFDHRPDVHRVGVGMTQNVRHSLLDQAINGLGEQAVDLVQPGIDLRRQLEVRCPRPGIVSKVWMLFSRPNSWI